MPDSPLAYFLTFRTYGTWLSGDPRGSVDDEHRTYGEPRKLRDDFRANYQARRMSSPSFLIDPRSRSVVEDAISEVCDVRGWDLWAMNVRTNHVHIVCSSDANPEKVVRDIKAYSTRALRSAGLAGAGMNVWATGASTKYAWDEPQADAYIGYTLDRQGDDLPGAGWRKQRDERRP